MKGSKYEVALKQEAIKMIKEEGQSVIVVSKKIGVHIKTLYRWFDEYKRYGKDAFPGKHY
jgi:transposase